MQEYRRDPAPLSTRTIIPFEEVLPPPATVVDVPPPQSSSSTAHDAIVGKTVTWANLGVTAIIITAMYFDGSKVQTAIIVGATYFSLAMGLYVLTVSGSLTAIVGVLQREYTERRRIDAYQSLGEMTLEWRMLQEVTLTTPRGATQGAHRLSPLGDAPNYVTPYLEGQQAAVEGLRWATALYDAAGFPDRRKVQADGRLLCRMIGSKRGGGSRESGLWLLRNGVIVRVRKGYALNVARYSTVADVRRLL